MTPWRESERARDARMAEVTAEECVRQEKLNTHKKGMLDALRELHAERKAQHIMLQGELELLQRQLFGLGGDKQAIVADRSALEEHCDAAVDRAEGEAHASLTLEYMHARLHVRRPHYPKKLAFLRSSVIEMDHRLAEAIAARDLACSNEEVWGARLLAEKARVAAMDEYHFEQRALQAAKLAEAGSSRRKQQMDLLPEAGGNLSNAQVAQLRQVVTEENAEIEETLRAENERAAKKADEAYLAATDQVVRDMFPAQAGAKIARHEKDEKVRDQLSKRQAWQKITTYSDCPQSDLSSGDLTRQVAHVLDFFADKMETQQTLKEAEEDRLFKMQWAKDTLGRHQVDLAAARDSVDSARAAFDEKLDAMSEAIAAVEARYREARRGCERVEGVATEAVSMLGRGASVLSDRVVTDTLPPHVRSSVSKRSKQLDEIENAMARLRAAPTFEKVARFQSLPPPSTSFQGLDELKREGRDVDQLQASIAGSNNGRPELVAGRSSAGKSEGGSVVGDLRPAPPKRSKSNCSQSTIASASTAVSVALEQSLTNPLASSRSGVMFTAEGRGSGGRSPDGGTPARMRQGAMSGAMSGAMAAGGVLTAGGTMAEIAVNPALAELFGPALAELLGIDFGDDDEKEGAVTTPSKSRRASATPEAVGSRRGSMVGDAGSRRGSVVERQATAVKKVRLTMSDLKVAQALMLTAMSESALGSVVSEMGWTGEQTESERPDAAPQLGTPAAQKLNLRIPRLSLVELTRGGRHSAEARLRHATSPTRLGDWTTSDEIAAMERKLREEIANAAAREELAIREEEAAEAAATAAAAAAEASVAGAPRAVAPTKASASAELPSLVPEPSEAGVTSGSRDARDAFKLREYAVLQAKLGKAEAVRRATLTPETRQQQAREKERQAAAAAAPAVETAAEAAAPAPSDAAPPTVVGPLKAQNAKETAAERRRARNSMSLSQQPSGRPALSAPQRRQGRLSLDSAGGARGAAAQPNLRASLTGGGASRPRTALLPGGTASPRGTTVRRAS